MTFDDILRELRRCRSLIFATTTIGIAAAIAYWFFAPEQYESYARVLIMPKDPAVASATREDETYDQRDVSDDLLATHLELLRSTTIVDAALKSKELASMTSIEPNLDEGESPTDFVVSRLWTFQGGEENGKDARIINVGFRHFDAEDSRRIVESVLKAYQTFLSTQFEDVNSEATTLISQAQEKLEKELESLETEHLALRREGPLQVQRGDRISNVHEDAFAEIEAKIAEIRIRLADSNGRLKAIRAAKAAGTTPESAIAELSLIGAEDASRLSVFTEMMRSAAAQPAFLVQQPLRAEAAKAEYEELATLKAEEQTLLEDYGNKHPDVKKVRNEIAAIQEALEKRKEQLASYEGTKEIKAVDLLDAYTVALEQDVSVMKDRLTEMQSMASNEEQKAKALVNFDLNDKIMSSRIDRKQQLYDAVVSRLNDVSLRSTYGSLVNQIIDPPTYGERVWPRLSICGLAGAAGGFAIGFFAMLLTYAFNTRFRTIAELSRGVPAPILANLPRLEGSRPRWRLPKLGRSNKAKWSRLLDLQFSNRSDASVAIRQLRSAVLLGGKRDDANLVLVTSPHPGDGKSVVAANLALSIAQTGRSVLLIDGQITDPALHILYGCSRVPGIVEVLDGRAELDDVIQVLDTHLRLLSAGDPESSAADLFQSYRFAQFCDMVRDRFEYVILDGPAVLGTDETQALASVVDNVLLVARVSKTSRAETSLACREIQRHGGRLIGVVANSYDASRAFGSDTADVAMVAVEEKIKYQSNGHVQRGENPVGLRSHVQ